MRNKLCKITAVWTKCAVDASRTMTKHARLIKGYLLKKTGKAMLLIFFFLLIDRKTDITPLKSSLKPFKQMKLAGGSTDSLRL